jgi:CheY-like chemotaxis protein
LLTRFSLLDHKDAAAPLRILLVEDNPVNRLLATRLLEKRGHWVGATTNGQEALLAVEKGNYDIVLMDIQMPVMDGFEATQAIREKEMESGLHLPIVALTAHTMKGDAERCRAVGMDDYLSKPIQPKELDAILKKYSSCLTNKVDAGELVAHVR